MAENNSRARRGFDDAGLGLFQQDSYEQQISDSASANDSRPHRAAVSQPIDALSSDRKRSRRKRGGSKIKSFIAIAISLVVLVGGGLFAYDKISMLWDIVKPAADYPGPGESEITVTIDEGMTVSEIGDVLYSHDVVESAKAFVRQAKGNPQANLIQAGNYRMLTKMSASEALEVLVDPSNIVRNQITIPEGLRNSRVVEALSQGTNIPADQFEAVLANPGSLPLPAYAQDQTEGYLFPNTYDFDEDSTAESLLTQMVDQFNSVAEQIDLSAGAQSLGYSEHDVVVIASIIERENFVPKYAADVAQVIYNRLAIGMKLEMDSTVHYAVNDDGSVVTTSDEQRAVQSPYNTYQVVGLPPGAISNPGETALEAAIAPSKGDYLYFVTVNLDTGEMKFASTYEQHEANVSQFQQWCQTNEGRC